MIKRSIQLGLSKLLKQVLSFTMFAALFFARKLDKMSSKPSVLKSLTNKIEQEGDILKMGSHVIFFKFSLIDIPSISFGRLSLFNYLQALSSLTYKRTPPPFISYQV